MLKDLPGGKKAAEPVDQAIPSADVILEKAKEVEGLCSFMNCKLFSQQVSGIPNITDLPKVKKAQVGDIYAWPNGTHYAVDIGKGRVIEVEEWGAPPRTSNIKDLINDIGPLDAIYRPPLGTYAPKKVESSELPSEAKKALEELPSKKSTKADFSTIEEQTRAFENEPVSSIREQWIGGVSGVGDRTVAYDLPYVTGGPEYQQRVQQTIQDSLGDNFKGYRLMHKDELDALKTEDMGMHLASFSLDKKTAESFANLAAYRRANPDDLVVVEMDLTPKHVWMMGKRGEKELVVNYGEGYNPDSLNVSKLPPKEAGQ
jgi:hypothetical protein